MTTEDCSTAFWFNLSVACFFYFVLFISAPWIADFYNRPILKNIVRVESICIFLNSLVIVQVALVNKNINFKRTTTVNFTSTILSGIIGIACAYRGFGVWSLVVMHLSSSVISIIMYWYFSSWRPKFTFNKKSFKYLFDYGSKLMATGILDVVFTNLYPIVIGKFFSASELGFYTRAQSFAKLPSSTLTGIIQRVTFPVLSTIQNDLPRLRDDYRRLLKMSCYIIFPLMMGLAAIASPLVRVLLTDKWASCILYLQIICFALMWYPVHAININLLMVCGRSDLFLRLEIVKKIMQILVIVCSIPFGVLGMCIGSVVSSILSLILNTYYTGKLIDLGFIKQMNDILPYFIFSLIMGTLVYLSGLLISHMFVRLILGILLGIVVYFGESYLFKVQELKELINVIKTRGI